MVIEKEMYVIGGFFKICEFGVIVFFQFVGLVFII